MSRILLTHSPDTLRNYYGDRALAGLRQLGEVKLHGGAEPLAGEALIAAAADCDLVVSYRQSPAPAPLFERLPRLVAFLRCAIDIRNIDVAAASKAGVLVTQASAGFVTSVSELVLGFLVNLSRGVTESAAEYHAGRVPQARMGRELKGSTLGVIGYGAIGREVVRVARALGMQVLVFDPYVKDVDQTPFDELLAMKRGIILVGGHFGNWELGGVVLRLLRGYPLSVVGKPETSPIVQRFRLEMRDSLGIDTIEIGQMLMVAAERNDLAAWEEIDHPYHETLLDASGNLFLRRSIEDIRRRLQRLTYHLAIQPEHLIAGTHEHVALAQAISERKAELAADIMRQHLETMHTMAMRLIRTHIVPVRGERF